MRCRSSWLLFYIIEAVAVYSVLAKYPNDADAAVSCRYFVVCCPPDWKCALFSVDCQVESPAVLCRPWSLASKGMPVIYWFSLRPSLSLAEDLRTHLQARAVGKLVTIPKKMLPMRLQLFKQLLLKGVNPLRPAAAIALADAPTSGILTVPGIRWVLPGMACI